MIEIKLCETDADFACARQVVEDYILWLDMDVSFQDIDEELAGLPAMYGRPHGLFLLAWRGKEIAGGVGLRMLEPTVCEMKRLYVYDRFKHMGVGRGLCTALIREARHRGYRRMRLDTLGRMQSAIRLYTTLGFSEIEPYRFNPDPTTRYMELGL